MSNLNKIYHKGRYRSREWAKHLRPYLKRLGNRKFRKTANQIDDPDIIRYKKPNKSKARKKIHAKITIQLFGNRKVSYYKKFRTMRDLNNAVNRPNVIRYLLLSDPNEN